jgi:HEAT repeat protein
MSGEPVPNEVAQSIDALVNRHPASRADAFPKLLRATEMKVGWADLVWKDLLTLLDDEDNHIRSIAGQVLCNLAKSTKADTVLGDLDKLAAVTRDKRFVTARHVLQSLWKVGLATQDVRNAVVDRLVQRFETATGEKNSTLIRYDILCAMRSLFAATGDDGIRAVALALIPTEQDEKYRKKYESVWRGSCRPIEASARGV